MMTNGTQIGIGNANPALLACTTTAFYIEVDPDKEYSFAHTGYDNQAAPAASSSLVLITASATSAGATATFSGAESANAFLLVPGMSVTFAPGVKFFAFDAAGNVAVNCVPGAKYFGNL